MKILFILTVLISNTVFAKSQVCNSCKEALNLEKTIANSQIVPDQFNDSTKNKQDEFITLSEQRIHELLIDKNFTDAHAYAVLKLLSRITCFYDNENLIVTGNRTLFSKIYSQKNSPLKKELAKLTNSGDISNKRAIALLEFIGAIPSKDSIDKACEDYK